MHDISLVLVLLAACAAIGLPLCLLLPAGRFRARFAIAPPIGFGVFAIGGTVLYMSGIKPPVAMIAMATAGLAIGAVYAWRTGLPLWLAPRSKPAMALSAGTFAIILIGLLPGWTGGPQFRVFQANAYDQMVYLVGPDHRMFMLTEDDVVGDDEEHDAELAADQILERQELEDFEGFNPFESDQGSEW